jgi:hypothetical protein
MSADDLSRLEALARSEQAAINGLLSAVGDADDETANAVLAAGTGFGFVAAGPPTDLRSMLVPVAQRPGDQVPDPREPTGVVAQQAIRDADMAVTIRETQESETSLGEEVTTIIMQDGGKQVITQRDPFEWPSKYGFVTTEQYDKNGELVSQAGSWHDVGTDCDITSMTWPDGSNFTMTLDPSGFRTAGFTTALGNHRTVPVEVIDDISTVTGLGLTGLEKHIANGGGLPMLSAPAVEDLGRATKFGGPALSVATTIFDMAMADTAREACVDLVAGTFGAGGGWAGAEAGALAGTVTGVAAPVAVPAFAIIGSAIGGLGMTELGEAIGNVVCPY